MGYCIGSMITVGDYCDSKLRKNFSIAISTSKLMLEKSRRTSSVG